MAKGRRSITQPTALTKIVQSGTRKSRKRPEPRKGATSPANHIRASDIKIQMASRPMAGAASELVLYWSCSNNIITQTKYNPTTTSEMHLDLLTSISYRFLIRLNRKSCHNSYELCLTSHYLPLRLLGSVSKPASWRTSFSAATCVFVWPVFIA
jgi:hypothetical protein